jgi:hypothetical protein
MSNKIVKIGYWALLAISILLTFYFIIFEMGKLDLGLSAISDLPSDMKITAIAELANNWGGSFMVYAIGLFFLCAGVTIIWALAQLLIGAIENKESAKKLLITFGGGAVIVIVSYILANNTVPFIIGLEDIPTPATCKLIEAGLFVTYVVAIITIVTLVYGEVSKIWK